MAYVSCVRAQPFLQSNAGRLMPAGPQGLSLRHQGGWLIAPLDVLKWIQVQVQLAPSGSRTGMLQLLLYCYYPIVITRPASVLLILLPSHSPPLQQRYPTLAIKTVFADRVSCCAEIDSGSGTACARILACRLYSSHSFLFYMPHRQRKATCQATNQQRCSARL